MAVSSSYQARADVPFKESEVFKSFLHDCPRRRIVDLLVRDAGFA